MDQKKKNLRAENNDFGDWCIENTCLNNIKL